MIAPQLLDQITDLIVSVAAPRYVYLFGSQADGRTTEDSDVDVFVVVGDNVRDTRRLVRAIHIALSDVVSMPCDVLVETESVFRERSILPTLERTVLETGKTLYAA